MPILPVFVVMLLLFLLFPKGFKYFVGTWVGVAGGGFFWGLFAIAFPALITAWCFVSFIIVGIIVGCIVAANG